MSRVCSSSRVSCSSRWLCSAPEMFARAAASAHAGRRGLARWLGPSAGGRVCAGLLQFGEFGRGLALPFGGQFLRPRRPVRATRLAQHFGGAAKPQRISGAPDSRRDQCLFENARQKTGIAWTLPPRITRAAIGGTRSGRGRSGMVISLPCAAILRIALKGQRDVQQPPGRVVGPGAVGRAIGFGNAACCWSIRTMRQQLIHWASMWA